MNLSEIIKKNNNKIYNPYIIAEAGVNHEGKMDIAIDLINQAAYGGANAIKFQTYKADKIASKKSPYYWDLKSENTKSQYLLFKKYDKFWKKEYEKLYTQCVKKNIEFISTPFDLQSAKFLNEMVSTFKISSSDITNKILIDYICDFNKPILLSTGASNLNEIYQAVNWIQKKNVPLGLLHCILNYPTKNSNANLGMIKGLKNKFPELTIGYSDHTMPGNMDNLLYSSLLGAKIIEKHFTHNKLLNGNDHYHAMDVNDLKILRKKLYNLKLLVGSFNKKSIITEKRSRLNARRSIYASKIIKKGESISLKNIIAKRPSAGISPSKIDKIMGKKTTKLIKKDELIIYKNLK